MKKNEILCDKSLKAHKFILFCEEHYNPLGLIRSLGESGIKSILIILKNDIRFIEFSKYVEKFYIVDSISDGYKLLLDLFGNEAVKPFLYTADDRITEFLDNHFDEIKDKFIFYNAGKAGQISYYMDKYNILKIAEECGLDTLKTWVVENGKIPKDIEYPIMTKSISPNVGKWKGDVYICNDKEELNSAFAKIQSPKVLLQKYIVKKNELCLDGFSCAQGGGLLISIASEYNYLLPNTYSNYMRVFNFEDKELYSKLKLLFKKIGFDGIFSIEFLIDQDGKKYFSEINFRNSTWSYASTCAGMPLPIFWAEAMLSGEIKDTYLKKIPENFNAMVEFPDFTIRVLGKKIGLFKWLKQKRECKCLYVKGRYDPKPSRKLFWSKVFGKFSRKRKSA